MIAWATDLVSSGGLAGVFLLMVAENLFPPLPSEVVMPLAGFAAAQGKMPIIGVLIAGIAGSITGNAFWFELARAYGAVRMRRMIARLPSWVGLGPAVVARAEEALRRNGPAAVFLARMMPGLRTGISVPAGLVELPRRVFYFWTFLGTSLWTGGLAMAGYLLEDQFHVIERYAGPVGGAILVAVLLVIGWKIWRARRQA